jgi:serine phosphatase RsbU (regulator of sigma subunit)
MVLGRHPDCDVVIEVGAVSRYHAQVLLIDGEYFVEDLNSRNGTFVNERLIHSRQRLAENDRVRVCDVSFSFLRFPSAANRMTTDALDASSSAVLVDDDPTSKTSTVMTKLDVTSRSGSVQISSSPDVKLSALLEITGNLGKALSLDEVLPQVLKSLFKIFVQADRGFIVLRSEDGELVPRWTKFRREGDDETIRISRTVVNQVMESREAVLSADAATDERFEMSQSIADFRIRSMMCAPLVTSDGDVLGVLQIDTLDQKKRFQAADLEVLVSVAAQAAVAIDNARLHDRAVLQQAMQRELEVAHQVQQSFLPQVRPKPEGYQFYDFYRPANQIGGDYYDYVTLPDGRLAVVVADVVGHGVAAALLMAKLSAEMRYCLVTEPEPAKAVERLNAKLCADSIEDRFVTMVMAVLDPVRHEVTIVNAGHMAPLLTKGKGQAEELGGDVSGPPLGIVDDLVYDQFRGTLGPGQILVMFTDGIHEAVDAADELFGLDRVRRQVAQGAKSPEILGRRLIDDVNAFMGSNPPLDDMCLVCLGRTA